MNRFILVVFMLFIACKSPSQENKLEGDLTKLQFSFSHKKERDFLANFPRNFSSFKMLFGWNEEKDKPEILYHNANQYIDYFFSLLDDPANKEYEKLLISICKGGYWEADAIDYFQEKTINYIVSKKRFGLVNDLSSQEAKQVLKFLLDTNQPTNDFFQNLSSEKKKIANDIISENVSHQKKRGTLSTYENNDAYFIKTFDINKDGIKDKIVTSKPYQGEDLFVFFGGNNGDYNLVFETTNFSQDGGNIIQNIKPLSNLKGFSVITFFPDKGYFVTEYNIIMKNDAWILKNIIYNTTSSVSEDSVIYICDVAQNIDMTQSGWKDKIIYMPDENERSKKCRTVKNNIEKYYLIYDPDGFTNLRKDKTTTSEVLQRIKSGEQIEILDNAGDWFLVKTKEGKKGYVHKSRIKAE